MNIDLVNKVNKLIKGKTFDDLIEIMEGLEKSDDVNVEIELIIMNKMEELDSERFIEWADSYEWEYLKRYSFLF